MKKVIIYTDGSAKGNPGPGGYGVVLKYTDENGVVHEREISGGHPDTTNNRMELMAAIVGLEALNYPCEVDLYSDSKYLIDAFQKDWVGKWIKSGWKKADKKPVLNTELWERLLKAKEGHEVNFCWVKGHAGNPENERCDKLAQDAADGYTQK